MKIIIIKLLLTLNKIILKIRNLLSNGIEKNVEIYRANGKANRAKTYVN